jgi:hypothetical protein
VNDVRSVSVVLRNNTAQPQAFEFGVPEDSALHFIPRVGEVPPASTLRIKASGSALQGSTSVA